jgi:hypothetical protein
MTETSIENRWHAIPPHSWERLSDLAQASRHAEQPVAQAREAARGFAGTQWRGIALGSAALPYAVK